MKKYLFLLLALFYIQDIIHSEGLPVKHSNLEQKDRISITWGGHSTVLIDINGKKILTDPLLTDRVGGITKRVTNCKLNLDSIGKPDIILLSHSHFDHLCMSSLKILEKKFPGTNIVFPEGVENFLPDLNFQMHRLKTSGNFKNTIIGETIEIDRVKITSVYAKHSGGRFGIDSYFWKDKGHTGFIIEYCGTTVYFSGDTGYDSNAFKKLGKKYKIDMALIQLSDIIDNKGKGNEEHVSPGEALSIFIDLKASFMIPVHYGSIEYDVDADYPVYVLKDIINRKYEQYASAQNSEGNVNINIPERVIIPDEGKKFIILK